MLAKLSSRVVLCKVEYGKEMGKPQKDNQKKKFRGVVEFLGVNYPTMDSLKAVFKALIVKTKNDAIIEGTGKEQVIVTYQAHGTFEASREG